MSDDRAELIEQQFSQDDIETEATELLTRDPRDNVRDLLETRARLHAAEDEIERRKAEAYAVAFVAEERENAHPFDKARYEERIAALEAELDRLRGALRYMGGFARGVLTSSTQERCPTCGSDDPKLVHGYRYIIDEDCPDPFHSSTQEEK